MSYRRRRRYKSSTNVIKMKFQSFMDINTTDSSMQIITISAGGPEIMRRLSQQFGAYKYYKIGNISVKLIPASTLPCDPSGLSLESGEPGVDPRDQLTPGLMRITNGEDIFEDLTGLSSEAQFSIYNNMCLDPRWYKWMLQSGVKRYASPRYWQIGQLHQDKWPGAIQNVPLTVYDGGWEVSGTGHECTEVTKTEPLASQTRQFEGSSPYGFFQTGHRGVLGWLPTDGLQYVDTVGNVPLLASPPEVEVMKIILPKAYKTKYYYRMFITETVYFKEPIVNFGVGGVLDNVYRPLDVFHMPGHPTPMVPSGGYLDSFPRDSETGGNNGDD